MFHGKNLESNHIRKEKIYVTLIFILSLVYQSSVCASQINYVDPYEYPSVYVGIFSWIPYSFFVMLPLALALIAYVQLSMNIKIILNNFHLEGKRSNEILNYTSKIVKSTQIISDLVSTHSIMIIVFSIVFLIGNVYLIIDYALGSQNSVTWIGYLALITGKEF